MVKKLLKAENQPYSEQQWSVKPPTLLNSLAGEAPQKREEEVKKIVKARQRHREEQKKKRTHCRDFSPVLA